MKRVFYFFIYLGLLIYFVSYSGYLKFQNINQINSYCLVKKRKNEIIEMKNLILASKNIKMLDNCQKVFLCKYMLKFINTKNEIPTIYIITPTYFRETQMADLIRLRNTLLIVPKIVWIIIEDSLTKSDRIATFAMESNLDIIHLAEKTLKLDKPSNMIAHKGTEQRNRAIYWIKENGPKNAVVYFADDDNSYSYKIFEEVIYSFKYFIILIAILRFVQLKRLEFGRLLSSVV